MMKKVHFLILMFASIFVLTSQGVDGENAVLEKAASHAEIIKIRADRFKLIYSLFHGEKTAVRKEAWDVRKRLYRLKIKPWPNGADVVEAKNVYESFIRKNEVGIRERVQRYKKIESQNNKKQSRNNDEQAALRNSLPFFILKLC